MPNENTISVQDQQAILGTANRLYYVEEIECVPGYYSILLDADYRDDNEFLLQTAYDHRDDDNGVLDPITEEVCSCWEVAVLEAEDRILRVAGFDPTDEAYEPHIQWLRDHIPIEPPVDHFLGQDMKVNIMLSTQLDRKEDDSTPFMLREALMHFTGAGDLTRDLEANIHSQAEADEIIHQDSMIKRLVEQQGFTMDDLSAVAKDFFHDFFGVEGEPDSFTFNEENGEKLSYDRRFDMFTANHSKFLSTVCQELDNLSYSFGVVTVLANMNMKDYAKMLQQGSEVTMPRGSMIGLFAPWNGSGSVLGIELDKDFTFQREEIYDTQIEGAKPGHGYTVDQTCGLVSSAWQKPKAIEEKLPQRKPGLDLQIRNATAKSAQATMESALTVQQER